LAFAFSSVPLSDTSSVHLAVQLSSERRGIGFTVFHSSDDNDDLAPAPYTGSGPVRVLHRVSEATCCVAFWLKPVSVFGLSIITVLIAVHLC
jgi:hypothetical protein